MSVYTNTSVTMFVSRKVCCSSNVKNFRLPNFFGVRQITSNVKNINTEISEIEKNEVIAETEVSSEDKEAIIEASRNKSMLKPCHRNMLYGNVPYEQPMAEFHETVKYKRKLYGRYGTASGVYPGIMWPSKEDIEDRKEYERVAYPLTLEELIKNAKQKLEDKESEIQARQQDMLNKMKKVKQWRMELEAKTAKKLAEANAAKEKKEKLIEEVRRHFGYKVNPKDERFQEMLLQKEKEEKKKAKELKKKQREEMLLAQFLEKNAKTDS